MKLGRGNDDQFASWNGESGERWVSSADRRDAVWAPVTEALLRAAAPWPGERVVDLGCGCGATTLAAGRAVNVDGAVLGVDLSEAMLDVARARAEGAALDHVTFVQADVQATELSGPFDLAMGRFGTMFFADPSAAFANVARSMVPGGRLCLVTWRPLLDNEWIVVPGAALLAYGSMPDAGAGPGMFSQSEPEVVTEVLLDAGFADVRLDPVDLDVQVGRDLDTAVAQIVDFGPCRAVLDTVPDTDKATALAAVAEALARHQRADGTVHLTASVWLVRASVPVG